jgi:hypothetical protein
MMDRITGSIGGNPVFALESETRTAQLAAAGFQSIEYEVIRWSHRFTAESIRALYTTFSNVTRLAVSDREVVLGEIERVAREEFGGAFDRPLLTAIYTARKPR